MERLLLTPAEVAQALGIGRSKAYEMCAKNELKVVRIGKSVRVPVVALHQWMEEQTQTNQQSEHNGDTSGRVSP